MSGHIASLSQMESRKWRVVTEKPHSTFHILLSKIAENKNITFANEKQGKIWFIKNPIETI